MAKTACLENIPENYVAPRIVNPTRLARGGWGEMVFGAAPQTTAGSRIFRLTQVQSGLHQRLSTPFEVLLINSGALKWDIHQVVEVAHASDLKLSTPYHLLVLAANFPDLHHEIASGRLYVASTTTFAQDHCTLIASLTLIGSLNRSMEVFPARVCQLEQFTWALLWRPLAA